MCSILSYSWLSDESLCLKLVVINKSIKLGFVQISKDRCIKLSSTLSLLSNFILLFSYLSVDQGLRMHQHSLYIFYFFMQIPLQVYERLATCSPSQAPPYHEVFPQSRVHFLHQMTFALSKLWTNNIIGSNHSKGWRTYIISQANFSKPDSMIRSSQADCTSHQISWHHQTKQ